METFENVKSPKDCGTSRRDKFSNISASSVMVHSHRVSGAKDEESGVFPLVVMLDEDVLEVDWTEEQQNTFAWLGLLNTLSPEDLTSGTVQDAMEKKAKSLLFDPNRKVGAAAGVLAHGLSETAWEVIAEALGTDTERAIAQFDAGDAIAVALVGMKQRENAKRAEAMAKARAAKNGS